MYLIVHGSVKKLLVRLPSKTPRDHGLPSTAAQCQFYSITSSAMESTSPEMVSSPIATLPYVLPLALTAESSPTPENFFAKTPFTERLPPLWAEPFLDRFLSEGAWPKSRNEKPRTGGPARRK